MENKSEFALIKTIKESFSEIVKSDVVLGIGDDCSVINWDQQHYLITSTDMLIEDIHFIKKQITAEQLGWKSLAVSYSDLAAMGGGEPVSVYLSLGLPDLEDEIFIDRFFKGMKECLLAYGGSLLGGDTVRSEKIVINILTQGKIKKSKLKTRSKAQDGDIVCVTRELGNSEVGLNIILEMTSSNEEDFYKESHHKPMPQIEEANWLSQFDAVHAMIDISDGLASDLAHICDASNKSATINLSKIPIREREENLLAKRSFCEDYSLLFTIDAHQFDIISKNFHKKFGASLIPIGKIEKERTGEKIKTVGTSSFQLIKGFNHFN